jgi:hypothetical protein
MQVYLMCSHLGCQIVILATTWWLQNSGETKQKSNTLNMEKSFSGSKTGYKVKSSILLKSQVG